MQVRDRQWQQPLSLKGRPGYTEYISAYLGLPFIYCYLPQLPSAEKTKANPYNQGGQPVQPVKNAYNVYEKKMYLMVMSAYSWLRRRALFHN